MMITHSQALLVAETITMAEVNEVVARFRDLYQREPEHISIQGPATTVGHHPIGANLRIMSSQKAECARAKESGSLDEQHTMRPVWACSPAQTAMDRALASDALTVGRLILVFLLSLLLSRSCRILQHDGDPLSRAC